jgi:hypothetical protein
MCFVINTYSFGPPVLFWYNFEYTFYVYFFNIRGPGHRKYIPMYIQHDADLHSFLYMEIDLHVSGGTSIHHQEPIQLYLQHLVFVTL